MGLTCNQKFGGAGLKRTPGWPPGPNTRSSSPGGGGLCFPGGGGGGPHPGHELPLAAMARYEVEGCSLGRYYSVLGFMIDFIEKCVVKFTVTINNALLLMSVHLPISNDLLDGRTTTM